MNFLQADYVRPFPAAETGTEGGLSWGRRRFGRGGGREEGGDFSGG